MPDLPDLEDRLAAQALGLAFKPAGSFDARACRVSGMYTLYVRYVGARADLRPIEEVPDGVRS